MLVILDDVSRCAHGACRVISRHAVGNDNFVLAFTPATFRNGNALFGHALNIQNIQDFEFDGILDLMAFRI